MIYWAMQSLTMMQGTSSRTDQSTVVLHLQRPLYLSCSECRIDAHVYTIPVRLTDHPDTPFINRNANLRSTPCIQIHRKSKHHKWPNYLENDPRIHCARVVRRSTTMGCVSLYPPTFPHSNLLTPSSADFQHAKKTYKKTGKASPKYQPDELDRGFLTSGLFAWSRHPNFAAEQGVSCRRPQP